MNASLRLNISRHTKLEDGRDQGREFIRYQPVFRPDCCATGELRFAVFEVWSNEPDTHGPAQAAAMASARRVMAGYGTIN